MLDLTTLVIFDRYSRTTLETVLAAQQALKIPCITVGITQRQIHLLEKLLVGFFVKGEAQTMGISMVIYSFFYISTGTVECTIGGG